MTALVSDISGVRRAALLCLSPDRPNPSPSILLRCGGVRGVYRGCTHATPQNFT